MTICCGSHTLTHRHASGNCCNTPQLREAVTQRLLYAPGQCEKRALSSSLTTAKGIHPAPERGEPLWTGGTLGELGGQPRCRIAI